MSLYVPHMSAQQVILKVCCVFGVSGPSFGSNISDTPSSVLSETSFVPI